MEHKAYIDSLRGFAIFVVVIGHCCEFGLGHNNTLFNYMYYSFHMPLFMFISGLVAFHRPDYKFILFVKSKACRLLIPFFVVGGLSCLARNIGISDFLLDFAKKGYWFLLLIFSGILFAFIYRINGAISIVGYFLVPVIYLLFKNSKKLGTAKCFSKMGGQTLQIYVLHYFMIPSIRSIANFIDNQQVFFINNHNFLLYAFISIIIASMVIICTLSVVKIIELSPVLNFILFGINPKGK